MAEPPISEAVSQAQGEQAAQQQLDDFRKNAAYNALVQTYGPAAGDPDAWAKSAQAKQTQDVEPYAAPTAQAELQGKQLGNADQTIKNQDALRQQQGQALYSVTQMAKSAANPDGSIDPDKYDQLFSNPLVQKATGVTPDQVAQAKPLITGPGGMQHLDSIATAALGPVKAQGAVGYGTDANGNPVQIGRDQYGRPIMQPLNGVTPTAVTNANTKQNNSLVVPGQPYDLNTATAAIKQGFPDARITSTVRTPDHNAAIGGAPNSAHTVGRAMDLGIPKGAEGPAYADQVNAYLAANNLPGHAVYESADSQYSTGPHVHYEWPAGAGGAPQVNQAYVNAKKQVAENAAKAGVTLTPEAVQMFAEEGARTGKIQTFGMGGKNNTAAIGNKMAANGVTGQQLAETQQDYKSAQTYQTDLAKSTPTSAGGMARMVGAVAQHIDTLDGLVDAMQNKNIKLVNSFMQKFKQQTGNPAPTNFAAQKQVVSSEVQKYLNGGRATQGDRRELESNLSQANSPQALRGVIGLLRTDLGAQLRAQYAQAQGFGKGQQFLGILTPEARNLLQPAQHAAGGGWAIKLVK